MQCDDSESIILIISSLLIALQLYWIRVVILRNRRKRLEDPLSAQAFQREIKQIFSRMNELPCVLNQVPVQRSEMFPAWKKIVIAGSPE